MTNYKVSNLDSKTTKEQCQQLTKNLQAVDGIEDVEVNQNRGEISLSYRNGATPSKSAIEKVVSNAGFTLGAAQK